MKFARYLQDTQTPEWKKAYIDYRGLKKSIKSIRQANEADAPRGSISRSRTSNTTNARRRSDISTEGHEKSPRPDNSAADVPQRTEQESCPPGSQGYTNSSHRRTFSILTMKDQRAAGPFSIRSGKPFGRPTNPMAVLPLIELRSQSSPQENAFFDYIDAQLEKVESFYLVREEEMSSRTAALRQQLLELQDHSRIVQKQSKSRNKWTSVATTALKLRFKSHPVIDIPASHDDSLGETPRRVTSLVSHVLPVENQKFKSRVDMPKLNETTQPDKPLSTNEKRTGEETHVSSHDAGQPDISGLGQLDNYLYARKKLKKAVLEHYRGLELLQNYRILNLAGFRKALKKFEKITKIRVQEQYMVEKVDRGPLGSDKILQDMLGTVHGLYAQVFLNGDLRRATKSLRGGTRTKTHHFSVFRSGLLIGLSLPALASGIYYSTLSSTRDEIDAWDALLYIYAVMFIPICFLLLVGLNLVVWARSHINYTFIFELDLRSRLDYRAYFEIPSLLFMTLCYAFWLSFARIGSPNINPNLWPLVWLALTASIVFQPLPLQSRPSRYWLLKKFVKLLLSGTQRVEFADFWLGDQLCSLVFTLGNLYMFACVYALGFPDDWSTCTGQSRIWPVAFMLTALPFFIRLVQSIKRYADSGLVTHLINGGKYGVGLLYYLFYSLWRHQETHYNPQFTVWLIFGIIYTIYATAWDFLMDWSLLKPHSKNLLLRDELGYPHNKYSYYFAIATNVLIRFAWLIYIPKAGPSTLIRTFIAGFLEMLRRVQWNFYRLENEHLGNMDQYRVTREVPLPYTFDHHTTDEDDKHAHASNSRRADRDTESSEG